MADYTLHEGFPALRVQQGMVIRLNAISPTTGLAVAGVTASTWSIYGEDDSDEPDTGEPGLPVLILPIEGVE